MIRRLFQSYALLFLMGLTLLSLDRVAQFLDVIPAHAATTANSKIGGGQGSACTAGVLPATSTFTPNNNPNAMPMMAITP